MSWIVFPLCGIWFVLAYFLPSPVGVYAPAIPELGIVFAASGFLWAYALLRSEKRWTPVFRTSLVSGIVLGLVVAGALGLAAAAQQCPVLSPSYTSEPSLWQKSPNSPWQEGGKPVLFLYASVACPFCSASSWAIWKALAGFGTLSGATLGTSSPTDVYPNTPEVVFAGTSFSSSYISFDARENTNDAQIEAPALVGCTELAYVNAYGHGSFPFLVVNGIYWHSGTLLSPANLSGYTPDQVAQQVGNESGPAWNAVAPATYMLEAFLVKATGGQPASVASNANVQADLAQIT